MSDEKVDPGATQPDYLDLDGSELTEKERAHYAEQKAALFGTRMKVGTFEGIRFVIDQGNRRERRKTQALRRRK